MCELSALFLSIRYVGEKEKLFTFMKGLKPYARIELQRQPMDIVTKAIQDAKCLVDYQAESWRDMP